MESRERRDTAWRCGTAEAPSGRALISRCLTARNSRRPSPTRGDLESALISYEQALLPGSAAEAQKAKAVLEVCLGPETPQSLLDFFSDQQPATRHCCEQRMGPL